MAACQPRKITSPCERLMFLLLRVAGMSLRSIARRAGRSPHTVRRWVSWLEPYRRLGKSPGRLSPFRCTRDKWRPHSVDSDSLLLSFRAPVFESWRAAADLTMVSCASSPYARLLHQGAPHSMIHGLTRPPPTHSDDILLGVMPSESASAFQRYLSAKNLW